MLPETPKKKADETEKDVGFGQSHGYDREHGGPSGPGDAPAKPQPKAPANGAKTAPVSDAFRRECRDSRRIARDGVLENGGARVD
ncbi:MAG: hypothetical protein ABI183_13410 [Polyangiaceae bacterium]